MRPLFLHGVLLLSIGALLQGCAIVPGLDSVRDERSTAVPAPGSSPLDQPPDGAITSITPALIAQLQSELAKPVAPEVQALFGEADLYRIGIGDTIGIYVYDHPELVFSATSARR